MFFQENYASIKMLSGRFLLECLTWNHVVQSTGTNIHTTLSHHVIFSTKITHWSKALMKGIFSSVHHKTVWRP
jgi:hypothetical protein